MGQKDPVNDDAFNFRQQLEVADLNYKIAKTRLLPKVNANFGLSQDEQTNFQGRNGERYSYSSRYAGVSINWNIFDGFAAGANTRNALIRRRQLESDYHTLTEQLAQDAQTAVKQINFSARTMAIADRALKANVSYLGSMTEDFHRGVKSQEDVSQVQLTVYDAEIGAGNARTDYLLRIGEFLGTLNEDPIVANLPAK